MGASQSSRKLTIANDEDDFNVIRISDAVAKRLSQNANEAVSEPPVPKEVRATSQVHTAQAPTRTVMQHDMSDAWYPPFTISALEMQKQKEKELADQEQYWQRRLQNLEKKNEKINHVIDEEYKKALAFLEDCRVIKVHDAIRPCTENSQKVLKCYQENPRETLQCADLVQEFSNCVDQRRVNLMSARCN